MIHLVMAQLDYEGREPVRAFTTLEAAQAFLAKLQAHHAKAVYTMSHATGEAQREQWIAQHPAPAFWIYDRFELDTLPLDNE